MGKYHNDKVFCVEVNGECKTFRTRGLAQAFLLTTAPKADIMVFDSRKEYRRWLYLLNQEQHGEIYGLERQVEYMLVPAQYEQVIVQLKTKQKLKQKRVEAPVTYKADFQYRLPDGSLVVEDVKSAHTRKLPEYIIKRKLMLHIHGIRLKEIL